ncbi:KTSC domain-containing protein [Flavobacterium sp.]|uniref:KTSC domain-containing protein n=1 Tax=Flavobacterium sp. TaxID=239 RepID=UPI00374CD76F
MSTREEIRKAYRKQVKLWHPDKFPNDYNKQILALEKCKQINEAYSFLENYIPLLNKTTSKEDFIPRTKKQQEKYNDPNQRSNKSFLNIHRIRVISSKLDSVGYDATHLVLQVAFKNGSIYQYYNVSSLIYSAFIMHSSKDGYFEKYIANRFRRELVK